MGAKSDIEWTDASWSPIRARNIKTDRVGWYCEHSTTGCEFCYAESMNKRLGTSLPFKPGHRNDVELFLDEKMLLAPLRWKKPRMIFVCSMTDLFADFVPDEWIDKVFAVMALSPQHTFQVLTKRAERMRDYVTALVNAERPIASIAMQMRGPVIGGIQALSAFFDHDHDERHPMANVWLGVSAERQQEADERIPYLLGTPAAVRFVSAEPLLGPIDLIGTLARWQDNRQRRSAVPLGRLLIDWIIVGGESGSNARPMHPDWARSLRDQCAAAGVSFFFKQWGEWLPKTNVDGWSITKDHIVFEDGTQKFYRGWPPGGGTTAPANFLERVGKKAAGRLLDGTEHNAMPERVTA